MLSWIKQYVDLEHILVTPDLTAVSERVHYAMNIGAMALVTEEIGSCKSTALRYVTEKLHPSEYRPLYIIATTGAISELYRQFLHALGAPMKGVSKAIMVQCIRNELHELVHGKKLKTVLVIGEASLLRLEVFAELHTLTQFKPYLPIVLVGQADLVDSLMYRSSIPLASRIVARSHLEGVSRGWMHEYLRHHLDICGTTPDIFDEAAVTAIHQGS